MKYLPIENITYTTTLKEEELLSRLSAYVEPVKSNRFFNFYATNTSKPYKGQIIGSGFNIRRIIQYVFVYLVWLDWFCMCHKAGESNLSPLKNFTK
jgi:hypothetical protein